MKDINKLNQLEAFERVISTYQVGKKGQEILADSELVVLVAPSSSGRNTIIKELQSSGNYHFVVSDTTRKPRENNGVLEQNGREYWFKSEDEFLRDLEAGMYLEAEIIHGQQVSGMSLHELELAAQESKISITDIDIGGVENVRRLKPDTRTVMLLPPSYEVWMDRLHNRGHMDPEELKRRKKTAWRILKTGLSDDYFEFIVNDEFHEAARCVDAFAHGKPYQQTYDARAIAQSIVDRLET